MIERYTFGERLVHWISGFSYLYALATGLALYEPHLYWIAVVLGGGPTIRYWHPWIALLFVATVVAMLEMWRPDMKITAIDREWGRKMRHYIRNEDELVPPAGRFNLGQKYFFWIMLWSAFVLLLSGLVLWFPERIPWNLRGFRYAAVLLHEVSALATIGMFIIHVYMGTAMVRGSFTAMVRGHVTKGWAKTHHRLWYQRMTGR